MKSGGTGRRRFLVLLPLLPVLLAAACGVRTAPGTAGLPLRFGVITDLHYADRDPQSGRAYRESVSKLAEFVRVMNRERVDFVIELGDYKDQDPKPDPARTRLFLRTIESVFGRFIGPRFHVLGNHDEDSLSKAEFLAGAENAGIPAGRTYYAFEVKGVRFVVLDANFRSDGKAFERGDFAWEDCNLPAAELEWLKAELQAGAGPVVVFIHQQLDGEGAYFVRNAASARKILEDSGRPTVVFQGHRHEGAYSVINGIPYLTFKAAGEGSGLANNKFALVEIAPGRKIKIRGFGREDSRGIHFSPGAKRGA
jgi:predicted phosphodiesterase